MDCVLGFKVSSRILFFCLLHSLQVLFWVVHDSEDVVQARLWPSHLQGYSFSNRGRLIMLTTIWLQLQYAACLARFPHCPHHLFPSVAPSIHAELLDFYFPWFSPRIIIHFNLTVDLALLSGTEPKIWYSSSQCRMALARAYAVGLYTEDGQHVRQFTHLHSFVSLIFSLQPAIAPILTQELCH